MDPFQSYSQRVPPSAPRQASIYPVSSSVQPAITPSKDQHATSFVDIDQQTTRSSDWITTVSVRPGATGSETGSNSSGSFRSIATLNLPSDTIEAFGHAMSRRSGQEVLRAVEAVLAQELPQDWSSGACLWGAIEQAYFGSLASAKLGRNEDSEEFATALCEELLSDLEQLSLREMETAYEKDLSSAREATLEHCWELYEAMPAQWTKVRQSAKLIGLVQVDEYQKASEELLRMQQRPRLDEEECAVCGELDSPDDNLIVFCSKCNVAVHQKCYQIKSIPEEEWLCDPCKAAAAPCCAICLRSAGAMRLSRAGTWQHITCTSLIVEDLSAVPATCSLCSQQGGLCLPCAHFACSSHFHPECWRLLQFSHNLKSSLPRLCSQHSCGGMRTLMESRKHLLFCEMNKLSSEVSKQPLRKKTARKWSSKNHIRKQRKTSDFVVSFPLKWLGSTNCPQS